MQCNHPGSEQKNGIVKELFHSDTIMDKQNNYYHGMKLGNNE